MSEVAAPVARQRPVAASTVAVSSRRWRLLEAGRLPAVLVLVLLVFTAIEPAMLSPANVGNMLVQASYLVIFASAQMLVIVVRGFDLSLGTTVSTISVCSGMVMAAQTAAGVAAGPAVALGLVAGLAIGIAIGATNGFIVAYLRVNPFVATFGMLNVCLGIASSVSGGFQIFNLPAPLNANLYRGSLLGVPVPVLVAALVVGGSYVILGWTKFGRSLFLLGSNPRAVAVAGHNSRALLAGAYVMCSLLVAIGALLLTARTGSGEPNMGGSLMLESIAAAVIGGVSLRGGQASVAAPVVGASIITALSAGMNLARIDGYVQQILLGVVVIATVFLHQGRKGAR